MLNQLFNSILVTETTNEFTIGSFLACTACSLVLGAVIAWIYQKQNSTTKSFAITLALLPAIVQMVIMLVNGNLGTGVAVMGAFSLVRFRSAPGNAREICSIFLAMAVGLATGMGYLVVAAVFVVIVELVNAGYSASSFGETSKAEKILKITIPENLDYTGVFDSIFAEYTKKCELIQVRTANMGSLYKLDYHIVLLDVENEKKLIDELRCRNGNLEIICSRGGGEGYDL